MRDAGAVAVGGTLLSPRAFADWLRDHAGADTAATAGRIAQWAARLSSRLGPSASHAALRRAFEELFEPVLGYECRRGGTHSIAVTAAGHAIALTAFDWSRPLSLDSRAVLRAAADSGCEWAAGFNGTAIGVVDARPGVPRRIASLALDDLASRADAASLVALLLHAGALDRGVPAFLVAASDRSSAETRDALREGVRTALSALTRELPFDAGLNVLFRLLFVLFAEARALVPLWHRVYRDHYSLASLAPGGSVRAARGTWAALEGARRLLGEGCRAGTLQVAGFNGRLFAPGPRRRWARSSQLDSALDRPAADALTSLVAFRPARGGARQIDYAELDVEELGSIYERVLDLDPEAAGRARKESGSFYTPLPLTRFVVRRALAPLVRGRSSDAILNLRIVDPAMGSGAFLVAALRFLAGALEHALVEEGRLPEHDVTDADRRELCRQIAQRCLYGVDMNPMAVMLAKLSLWLATLSAGRPLGFLDHRLKCGNSLAGSDLTLAARAPGQARAGTDLPLFDRMESAGALRQRAADAMSAAAMTENSIDDVRRKQKAFESLDDGRYAMASWRSLCNLWCAWWFAPPSKRPDAREYRAIAESLIRGGRTLPRSVVARRIEAADRIAASERFFHWPLEFPEVFSGSTPGFDAVLGNPPWEMLRGHSGSSNRAPLKTFARTSGAYALATHGHVNLYQLFVERALQLVRDSGRVGMVLPWGLVTDDGSTRLRRALLNGNGVETLVRLDNGDGAFDAHRSLRFVAMTAAAGRQTEAFELTSADRHTGLDDLPDESAPGRGVAMTRAALGRVTPSWRVPDVASDREMAMLIRLTTNHDGLGDPSGWGASFGRELNLTEDKAAFSRSGMPILEGKHLHPFQVNAGEAQHRITPAAAARLLPDRPFDRARLAYRDVTAPTNRQTLIAAIVPAGAVTGHSLFCLRNRWDMPTQRALCAILNSPIANFLIRLFVSSHVTTSLMAWLPVPDRVAAVRALGGARREETPEIVARLYGLARKEREAIYS